MAKESVEKQPCGISSYIERRSEQLGFLGDEVLKVIRRKGRPDLIKVREYYLASKVPKWSTSGVLVEKGFSGEEEVRFDVTYPLKAYERATGQKVQDH